ncbi:MAG: LPS assembly lipoprotein LptE [Ignavibacteriaceae bacterium]
MINFVGCCAYSFTGASVPKHLKTIAIPIADDKSGSGQPGLAELLTTTLTQKFIDDNTLQVASKTSSDALIQCTVISLTDAPAVVAAGENVTSRKITITVQAVYKDLVEHKTIFNKNFSNYGDYLVPGSIVDRNKAIQKAINNISEDILLAVVSGW